MEGLTVAPSALRSLRSLRAARAKAHTEPVALARTAAPRPAHVRAAGPEGLAGLAGLVAAQVARKPRSRVRLAAVPAEKPTRTTLFTKAGPDGVSLGDCPFSHAVQIALKVKGVDYDVVPCSETSKPPWLVQEVAGQMPCVVHQGVAHVESSEILKWIDQTFPGPSLAVPADYEKLVSKAGIFPAVADFTKNTDSSKDGDYLVNLQMALTRFRMHLFSLPIGTRYACGDALTLADCEILPALYVIQSATSSLKGWSLNELPEKDEIRTYYARASELPAFAQSCYPPQVAVQGWSARS